MNEKEFKTFEERKAEKHIVSCSLVEGERIRPTMSISNCKFYGLNKENTPAIFSLTELDDKSGFHVHMKGVTVVPSSFICIEEAPKWLKFLIRKFCKIV